MYGANCGQADGDFVDINGCRFHVISFDRNGRSDLGLSKINFIVLMAECGYALPIMKNPLNLQGGNIRKDS